MRSFRTYWWFWALNAVLVLVLAVSLMDLAHAETLETNISQSVYSWVQAAGFPSWAAVLLIIGRSVIVELRAISERLDRHVTQTESRLSRLETMIGVGRHPARRAEDHQRRIDDGRDY